MNKKIVHDALILTAFTLVLGLILGIVYGITKDPIDKANADTARAAYQEVFKDAVSFEAYEYDKDEANQIVADGGYKDTIDDIQKRSSSFYISSLVHSCEVNCFLNDKNVVTVTFKVFCDKQDAKEVCLQLINTDIALFARSF